VTKQAEGENGTREIAIHFSSKNQECVSIEMCISVRHLTYTLFDNKFKTNKINVIRIIHK